MNWLSLINVNTVIRLEVVLDKEMLIEKLLSWLYMYHNEHMNAHVGLL